MSDEGVSDKIVVFSLAGRAFALPAGRVRECLPLPHLWRREGTPAHVAGFFALGGVVLPVMDLALLLGLRTPEPAGLGDEVGNPGAGAGLASFEAGGLYRHLLRLDDLALLVDRVTMLADRAPGPRDPHPDDWQNACVMGWTRIDDEPVALLDADRILLADEAARLRRLTEDAGRRRQLWTVDAG